jgi:hypothetical protein
VLSLDGDRFGGTTPHLRHSPRGACPGGFFLAAARACGEHGQARHVCFAGVLRAPVALSIGERPIWVHLLLERRHERRPCRCGQVVGVIARVGNMRPNDPTEAHHAGGEA